jgi:hypothetical protein
MNAEKFAAARRLNELENKLNMINEHIVAMQQALDDTKALQQRTAAAIAEHRLVVAAMPG